MFAVMPSLPVQHDPTREYVNLVERTEELGRLREQAKLRKSMLLFGPEGVGKSRLLHTFVDGEQLALYVRKTGSPRELLLELLAAIQGRVKGAKIPRDVNALSSSSLKGIAHRALDSGLFLMALDQLNGPSRIVSGIIKDLHYYGRTPIFFAARSPHMEDIGALQAFCALKSERTELRNWSQPVALEFAQREAEKIGLRATNLESALHSLVEWSGGNPASILQMLKMGGQPQYRVDDQIRAHILYVDYRMGRG
jgi:GTPase SAR1 family protein